MSQLGLWIHPIRISRSYVKMHAKMKMKFIWSGNWFYSRYASFLIAYRSLSCKVQLENGGVRRFYDEKFEVGQIPFNCKAMMESLTEVGNFLTAIDTFQLHKISNLNHFPIIVKLTNLILSLQLLDLTNKTFKLVLIKLCLNRRF